MRELTGVGLEQTNLLLIPSRQLLLKTSITGAAEYCMHPFNTFTYQIEHQKFHPYLHRELRQEPAHGGEPLRQ